MSIRHPFLAVSYLVLLGTGAFGSRSFLPKTDPSSPTSRRLNEYGDYSYAPAPGPSGYCESYLGTSCFNLPTESFGILAADISSEVYKDATDDDIYTYLQDILYATDVRFVTDEYTGTEAIVVSSDGPIFLAFRGTTISSLADIGTNASVDFDDVYLGNWTANIHSGYSAAVDSVYGGVVDIINELDPDNTKDIVITGHSLGGALASVAAAVLQADAYFQRYIYGIYTFGSPRVGDASWVDAYYNLGLWDKTLRYANKRDPIPAIPSRSSGYAHVGQPVIIDEDSSVCYTAEESDEDFDLCSDLGFWDTLGTMGCDFGGLFVTASTCVAAALVPGEQNLCGAMVDILDDGQACCALNNDKDYHGIEYYLSVVKSQCTPSCRYTQYLQCGAGYGDYEDSSGDYDYDDYDYSS